MRNRNNDNKQTSNKIKLKKKLNNMNNKLWKTKRNSDHFKYKLNFYRSAILFSS